MSVFLGEEGKESGDGLEHFSRPEDGLSITTVLNDVPCRLLHRDDGSSGYLYFKVDPTFKKGNTMDVTVEIEYFAEGRGGLGLQFDTNPSKNAIAAAYKKLKGGDPMKFQEELGKVLQAAYVDLNERVRFTGSKTWETATFHVRGATFNNSQHGGCDFRFRVSPAELYFRRVTVTRERK